MASSADRNQARRGRRKGVVRVRPRGARQVTSTLRRGHLTGKSGQKKGDSWWVVRCEHGQPGVGAVSSRSGSVLAMQDKSLSKPYLINPSEDPVADVEG
eukprot:scaffold322535_cov39-Tisochrysis_lutea.AAC.2